MSTVESRESSGIRAAWLLAVAVTTAGCGGGQRTAEEVVGRFVTAVQDEDAAELYCLLAGASQPDDSGRDDSRRREDFDAWLASAYAGYVEGRDRGRVPLGEDGVALVKTFALGKGTFYTVEAARREGGRIAADMSVVFGYGQINYGGLSPGTVFYLAAAPPGAVRAVRIPRMPREVSADVLERVMLRWELARVPATGACPEGWAVAAVRPIPGTASSTSLTWSF